MIYNLLILDQVPEQHTSSTKDVTKGSAEQTDMSKSGRSEHSNGDKLEQETDNDLPHSAVFVVSDLTSTVKSSYAGQIVTCVNPVSKIMSISFFTYMPSYSDQSQEFIFQRKMNEELCRKIDRNLEMFEVSRQLRMDIPLNALSRVHLWTKSGTTSPGLFC